MLSKPSRTSSQVCWCICLPFAAFVLTLSVHTEIYRIVSNKALQSSDDVIKPSGGETITVQPSADDGGQTKKNGCC